MSYTESDRTRMDTPTPRSYRPTQELRETKPSFRTTEFWAMLVAVAAIVVIYWASADASLNLWRACTLGTAVAIGYIVSRGVAKAGSHDDRTRGEYRDREGIDLRGRS